jgi:predicted molibdopterin-dependent oxidoreductase YjgC
MNAGYADAATGGKDTRAILEAAAAGEIDTLLLIGADPITDFPDADLAQRALDSKVFSIVVELFPTESALRADVVLPSAAYAERDGTFTNLERRLQKLERLMTPPGAARDPWKICASLAEVMGHDWSWHDLDDVWADIRKRVPTHAEVDIENLRQEAPAPAPFYDHALGAESGQAEGALGGPGGQYPKGHRAGAPFQTGQNWPLSWELRAFEAKQRPGFVPPPPGVSANGSTGGAEGRIDAEEASAATGSAEGGDGWEARDRASGQPVGAVGTPSGAPGDSASFVLYTGRMIYDEGAMVSKTASLRGIQRKAFVEMSDVDVKRLGVADGDEVSVSGNGFQVRLPVVVGDIVEGAVFVPYDQEGLRANRLIGGTDPTVEVTRA